MANWAKKYMDAAKFFSTWSKDKSTKVGATIWDNEGRQISIGYNGLPTGSVDDIPERDERPLKYKWYEHAERNAFYNAARVGVKTNGANMCVNYFPCTDCARAIIQGGIKNLYFEKILAIERGGNLKDPQWGEDFKIAIDMLLECRVNIMCITNEGRICNIFSNEYRDIIGEENHKEIVDYVREHNWEIEKLRGKK